MMSSVISTPSSDSKSISTIFQLGIDMDNDGKLSIDSTKFDKALDNNYEQVVSLFSGKEGVAGQLETKLKDYTKTGGLLSLREDQLNTELRSISRRESDAASQLTKYETNLRAQYASLDTLLAKMNKSASSLSVLTTS